ncbi:tripartite tricarboxylate transporter TctB family protein [Oscillibacter sp. 1-3]|uniref:tripartite tricarboxylate transporter TctB family protein n=1 Tax=Oscillibacter sp. 1-3 TaxID=1235797 RepID=UPI00033B404D|nr:tripartite tricarboxylate transporter TctB family protein [Oscillibacter sp. 1-3]EOS62972.1 hypothetical protein C816_03747 [Oscillibacter sp. 1-3]
MAKWKRDVIYGVVLIACCAFGVVETLDMRISGNPVFITRPDVYLWIWLGILAALAAIMIVRAVLKRDMEKCEPIWCKDGVFTVIMLFLYLVSMNTLGFAVSTFAFEAILILVYSKRMGKLDYTGRALVLHILMYAAAALVTTAATELLFTRVLSVRLPAGKLF